jgi:hypothetical protein
VDRYTLLTVQKGAIEKDARNTGTSGNEGIK